jgi:hypothetical protein
MAQAPKNTRAPAEPVNSEQLEGLEAASAAQAPDPGQTPPAPGPSVGELEERAAEAEDRAAAAETRAFSLEQEMTALKEQVALLMRAQRAAGVPRSAPIEVFPGQAAAGTPVFDEDEPYGLVVGDSEIAYVQNGHQFDRAKNYLATEEHRGVPRPFNPRLIGVTKPRPGQNAIDGLADFRDDPRRAQ